jgi:hypothetical protein
MSEFSNFFSLLRIPLLWRSQFSLIFFISVQSKKRSNILQYESNVTRDPSCPNSFITCKYQISQQVLYKLKISAESKGFWRWRTTLRITGVLDSVHCPEFQD